MCLLLLVAAFFSYRAPTRYSTWVTPVNASRSRESTYAPPAYWCAHDVYLGKAGLTYIVSSLFIRKCFLYVYVFCIRSTTPQNSVKEDLRSFVKRWKFKKKFTSRISELFPVFFLYFILWGQRLVTSRARSRCIIEHIDGSGEVKDKRSISFTWMKPKDRETCRAK